MNLKEKILAKWNSQSDSSKVLITIAIISIIGIIFRWKYILLAIAKGFGRYKGYSD